MASAGLAVQRPHTDTEINGYDATPCSVSAAHTFLAWGLELLRGNTSARLLTPVLGRHLHDCRTQPGV
jgi:hypothetical protein